MSAARGFGQVFPVEETATTSPAVHEWHASGVVRPRKVAIFNADATNNLEFKVRRNDAEFSTLLPGSAILIESISDSFTYQSSAGTVDFLATGEG